MGKRRRAAVFFSNRVPLFDDERDPRAIGHQQLTVVKSKSICCRLLPRDGACAAVPPTAAIGCRHTIDSSSFLFCVFSPFSFSLFLTYPLFFLLHFGHNPLRKKKSCPDLLKWPAIIGRLMEPRPLIVYLTTVSIINSHTDPSI